MNIMMFCYVWVPIIFGLPSYYLIKGIKRRNVDLEIEPSERKAKNIISYATMAFFVFCYAIILSYFIFEERPFIVLLLLLTFVVPVVMVIVSLIAGLGKAFEAGFSSRTILTELNSILKESNKSNLMVRATERYSTPDGILTLLVTHQKSDITIGFENFPWHTHAAIIANLQGEEDIEQALRKYLDDLFHDRLSIVLMMKSGEISDPYILDFPDESVDSKYLESNESYALRFWSGSMKMSNEAVRRVDKP